MFACQMSRRVSLLLSIVLLLALSAVCRAAEAPPPDIQAVYVDTPPVIDGQLDDPCWSKAARLEGFHSLNVDWPPPEETIGLICVDEKAIYVAVICNDRTPEDIVARETRRNGAVSRDDNVEFNLDPWHEHTDYGYVFRVNPLGTQEEEIPGGSATKIEWRGDWSAAAVCTPAGWQAEMAIPFSILHCPPDQTTFGFAITRDIFEDNIHVCYPDVGKTFDPTRTANLVGLRSASAGRPTILMPYVTADLGEHVGRRFDMGLDIKHKLPSGLTVLGSINPDFKQIEDVVEPISFSYTERYLDDPRPFFTTGQWGYLPDNDLLYTRRIEDFDTGLKVFGKVGNETIGLMDAVTFGEENTLASSWGHRFNDDNNANLSFVSHSKDGEPDNLVYSLGGNRTWRLPDGFNMLWAGLAQSKDMGGGSGGSYYLGGERYQGEGKFQGWFNFKRVTEGYNPAVGYTPEVNYQGGSFGFGREDQFEKGPLEEKGWYISGNYFTYIDGPGLYKAYISPSYNWDWRDGRRLRLAFTNGHREGADRSDGAISYSWKTRDMYRRGNIYFQKGNRIGGDYTYWSLEQGFRPNECVSLQLNVDSSNLKVPGPEAGREYLVVLTGNYDLSTEKSIAVRLIRRKAGLSGYASYRQVVRKGMDMYIILGDPDPEKTGFTERLVLKFIWAI
ncbi:MAG: hypothetical protein GTN69_03035 [Armatimonadetes bacterium]|nr:hypothetical protein [Armatimonadota bacterium]NIO74872.1 hypothetical protein [Armatimonadota bacterium]NIO95633.1 hypothetical protein [Armatimonadota bacterium]